jgi:hypothetical protein
MKLVAVDSFYTDETKHVSARQEFKVDSDETGKDLIKRGLAKEIEMASKSSSSPAGEKSEKASPQNKAEVKPQNKAAPSSTKAQ